MSASSEFFPHFDTLTLLRLKFLLPTLVLFSHFSVHWSSSKCTRQSNEYVQSNVSGQETAFELYFSIEPKDSNLGSFLHSLCLCVQIEIFGSRGFCLRLGHWLPLSCIQSSKLFNPKTCQKYFINFFNTILTQFLYRAMCTQTTQKMDPNNHRLYEHRIQTPVYIWHWQESNSQPVSSQVHAGIPLGHSDHSVGW